MSAPLITLERLRERLLYDPFAGTFVNRVQRSPRALVGQIAGYISGDGRPYLYIDGRYYIQARLAWFWVYGVWPRGEIDHKNGDYADNRFANLRDVSHQVNMENQRDSHHDGKLGLLGVTEHEGKFRARIFLDGRNRHLGLFETPIAAHAAYLVAKRAVHAGCTI